MRKYSLSYMIFGLMAVLLMFSIGYTYAYFSASTIATGNLSVNNVIITWYHFTGGEGIDADIDTLFSDSNTIPIKGELVRGEYCTIKAQTLALGEQNIVLAMSNDGNVSAYCRIKINATYTNKNNEQKDCSEWIKLARTSGTNKRFITQNGWYYLNGYYYYGSSSTSLTEVTEGDVIQVADYLYLDENSNADMYGASVSISVTLEAVQSTHDAYLTEWA